MGKDSFHGPLEQVDENCYRIPKGYRPGMRVDGLIFANEHLLRQIREDQAPEQVANVAFLPGIQHASLAMPDIHWGYGFCIGGVAATDPDEGGVISPGGVGYDINCGVRLVRSNLFYREVKPHIRTLVDELFRNVPVLVQLFLWFYVLPELVPDHVGRWLKRDLPLPEFWTSVVCLGFYAASRIAEQVRSGIETVPRGQLAAALASGLTRAQAYRLVLLPIAFRLIIPPLTSEFLSIIRTSSVALTIGVSSSVTASTPA